MSNPFQVAENVLYWFMFLSVMGIFPGILLSNCALKRARKKEVRCDEKLA